MGWTCQENCIARGEANVQSEKRLHCLLNAFNYTCSTIPQRALCSLWGVISWPLTFVRWVADVGVLRCLGEYPQKIPRSSTGHVHRTLGLCSTTLSTLSNLEYRSIFITSSLNVLRSYCQAIRLGCASSNFKFLGSGGQVVFFIFLAVSFATYIHSY